VNIIDVRVGCTQRPQAHPNISKSGLAFQFFVGVLFLSLFFKNRVSLLILRS
jgi:hypothetical protein